MTWLAVGIGGAFGSIARHAVNHILQGRFLATRFPVGTVAVNLIGCLAIGVLAGLIASGRIEMRPHWREFVVVGILGGFTTFSTFGIDTFLLSRTHSVGQAALNVCVQVAGGLVAVWAGYQLGVAKS